MPKSCTEMTRQVPVADRFANQDSSFSTHFLEGVRWGAIPSADSQALQGSVSLRDHLETYQLDPVVWGSVDAQSQERT